MSQEAASAGDVLGGAAERWASRPLGEWPAAGTVSQDEVAIVGHERVMFLLRGSNDYHRSYFQSASEAEAQADAWLRYCDVAAASVGRLNARFAFFMIPNKASVLAEHYPLDLGGGVTPRHAGIAERMAVPAAIPLDAFRRDRGRMDIFRRNDTHFTEYGNRLAMRELLAALGLDVSLIGFDGASREIENKGDLGGRLPGSPCELVRRPLEDGAAVEVVQLTAATGNVNGLTFSFDNPHAPLDRRIAVFGNSFFDRAKGWGMLPILARLYRSGIFRWTNQVDVPLVEAFRADDVVLQTCERFLGRSPQGLEGPPVPAGITRPGAPPNKRKGTAMRIAVADYGNLALLGRREGPVRFFAGERIVAQLAAEDRRPPLRALGAHRPAIERFGLTAVYADGPAEEVDLQEFEEFYYGSGNLIGKMQEMVGPGKWEVYKVLIRGTEVEAEGMVILSAPLTDAKFQIHCEGQAPARIAYMEDPGDGLSHWFMPDNTVLGFRAFFQVGTMPDFLRFELVFEDADKEREARHYRTIYRLTRQDLVEGLPDQARIARVAGSRSNLISFLNGGRTAFERLKDIARSHGVGVGDDPISVFDWGVGCGRVARFFAGVDGVSMFGADIDADNIEWCSQNLRGDYRTVQLMPPTPFDAGQFDLVYSCSVLSHLTEEVADAWLAEIHRLLASNGVALLSFNGSSNLVSYLGRRPGIMKKTIEDGMFDGDVNQDLKNYIPSDTYYRQTFATDDWWRKMFLRHFEVVDVERATVSGHQDIAVLKRASKSSRRRR